MHGWTMATLCSILNVSCFFNSISKNILMWMWVYSISLHMLQSTNIYKGQITQGQLRSRHTVPGQMFMQHHSS